MGMVHQSLRAYLVSACMRAWAFSAFLLIGPSSIFAADVSFVEVTESTGIEFVHNSGLEGHLWTLEITGAGVGILDADGDGWMDILLVQGGPLTNRGDQKLPHDRLFMNDGLRNSRGRLKFSDRSKDWGLTSASEYGMGVATGDVDNDGDTDILLANYGQNQLWLNEGSRFQLATRSLPSDSLWSISASFADLDADGYLDLFVGNYLRFSVEDYETCSRWSGRLSYCAPSNFETVPDQMFFQYRSDVEDVPLFMDVSRSFGLSELEGAAMGVIVDDLNDDGRPDIYVANDGTVNHLWINEGDREFAEDALMMGLAVNADGLAEASMGIAARDIDDDGDADLLVTHDIKESNTLYTNQSGWFSDESNARGLAADSLAFSAFGTGWFDADNDGDLDLFVANGAVTVIEAQDAAGIRPPLRQRNQLFLNDEGKFAFLPELFDVVDTSRGAAFGDLDNDGDTDLVISNNHGPARIYRNDTEGGHWLGLDVRGNPRVNPIGAFLWREFTADDGTIVRRQRRRVHTDGSYASANDPRVLYGLGSNDKAQSVVVKWPDGQWERFSPLVVNQYHVLEYGRGRALKVDD